MIILPVEKRLNWKNAPIVLFTLVIINIMTYFFYQMNDTDKYTNALELYVEQSLHLTEPALYDAYLQLPENAVQLETLQQRIDYEQSFDDLGDTESGESKQQFYIMMLLQDSDFSDYLTHNPQLFESKESFSDWQLRRDKVNEWIEKLSSTKYALVPTEKSWFTLITHQFMHGSLMHLAGNMFFLITCGFAVEAALGHLRFLLFYLLGGVAGGALHMYVESQSNIPLVGASGAISGVMAMYMGIFRLKRIEFFYWLYIFVGYFRAPALLILGLYIGKEAFYYFGTEGDNVAYMAHIGGFIGGTLLIFGLLLLKRDLLDEEYIEEDDSIDPLQVQQAEILNAIEKLHFAKAIKLLDAAGTNTELHRQQRHENAMLKAKLLFLTHNKDADDDAMTLMSESKANQYQLEDYQALWQKVVHKNQTAPEKRISLGLQFCELDNIALAEDMFNVLHKQHVRDERMSVFAGRIAHFYDAKGELEKADYYQDISLKLSAALA